MEQKDIDDTVKAAEKRSKLQGALAGLMLNGTRSEQAA